MDPPLVSIHIAIVPTGVALTTQPSSASSPWLAHRAVAEPATQRTRERPVELGKEPQDHEQVGRSPSCVACSVMSALDQTGARHPGRRADSDWSPPWQAGVVTSAVGAHIGPWREEDLVGLPGDSRRYELLEGTLLVSPPPSGRHQLVSWEVTRELKEGAPSGLVVVEAMGIRLPDGTLFIPDVLVAERDPVVANRSGILDPGVVSLVVQIVSPASRTQDCLTKPALYARAGIPSLLRVELEAEPTVFAYRLDAGVYVELSSTMAGEHLLLDDPFPISFDPGNLER